MTSESGQVHHENGVESKEGRPAAEVAYRSVSITRRLSMNRMSLLAPALVLLAAPGALPAQTITSDDVTVATRVALEYFLEKQGVESFVFASDKLDSRVSALAVDSEKFLRHVRELGAAVAPYDDFMECLGVRCWSTERVMSADLFRVEGGTITVRIISQVWVGEDLSHPLAQKLFMLVADLMRTRSGWQVVEPGSWHRGVGGGPLPRLPGGPGGQG